MLKQKHRTNILFPRTNFIIGAGSILNISGRYFKFNTSESEVIADNLALENDFGVIAQDIKIVLRKNPKKSFKISCNG
ncbi:MAG: hypothetical protein QM541_03850 [Flavobacterium sp.]|nr:hypothetical protein [Flavobacterium sp.]